MKFTVIIAVIIITTLVSKIEAQELGDTALGLKFAKEVCAECHRVSSQESMSPNLSAASFKEIANTPGMTAQALFVWFRTPHPTMPNFKLEIQNEDDVIAYILSLKDKN